MIKNKYVENIRRIACEHVDNLAAIESKVADLKAMVQSGYVGCKAADEQIAALNEQKKDIALQASSDVNTEIEAYSNAVDTWEAPTAEKLHPDLQVLGGMVPLSVKDLEGLAARHKGNPVMAKAIMKYAADNGLQYYSTQPTGEMKKKAFRDICEYVNSAIKQPTGVQASILQEDVHFEKVCNLALDSGGEA